MASQKTFKYDIDSFKYKNKEDSEEQANRIMFFVIKKVLRDDLESFERLYAVTEFLLEVTNKELFLSTINLFNEIDFSELKESIHSKMNIEKHLYSESQIIRIHAIIFANYVRYYAMKTNYDRDFSFKIKGNKIKVLTIDSSSNSKRKLVLATTNLFKNNTKNYDQLIGEMSNLDYERGTKYFKEEIEFLRNESKRVSASEKEKKEKKYENIFKPGSFVKFEKWVSKNTDEPYKKFSFIFQKLNADNELRISNFKLITNWLFENNYISRAEFEDFTLMKLNWITPKNILGVKRNKEYNMMCD
jgi:hypothetical protein